MNNLETTEQLEEALSKPTPGVVETLRRLKGDILVLGVGGKMGPSLARMARRASDEAGIRRRILGVSRFSDTRLRTELEQWGIEPVSCDLLDPDQLAALPDAPNIVYMAGLKFGSTGHESLAWAMNCYLPGMVCRRFPKSAVVAFSTGNVYGLTPVSRGGSVETDTPNPSGDYAMSCLGRERMFDYFSRELGIRTALIRLNYATELRYGVLADVARQVWAGTPVNVTMGYLNAIWQTEANAMALRAFDHVATPPLLLNVAGPDILRVRDVAATLGRLLDRTVRCEGTESPDALLSNAGRVFGLMGKPAVGPAQMMEWIAGWIRRGGASMGKPTHFEVRDGRF